MKIDESKKIDILISALQERYNAMHIIRERVQSIGIWALGLFLGVGGWLLQSNIVLNGLQKMTIVLGVTAAFIVLRFFYLSDLQKGFKGQQGVAVKIEKALGFFTPGVFNDSEELLYPKNWEKFGLKKSSGKFFKSTHALLYVGFIFLIIAILIGDCFPLKNL